jgi:hypothetical protein
MGRRLDNVLRIRSFGDLKRGWNGYDGLPFERELLERCVHFLYQSELLCRQPDIFPTGRGSIQFEYERADGRYLEIEIFSNGKQSVYAQFPNEEAVEVDNMQWPDIIHLVRRFDA